MPSVRSRAPSLPSGRRLDEMPYAHRARLWWAALSFLCLQPQLDCLSRQHFCSKRLGLFFDRLFSLLNCIHAANDEGCKIALHNFFFARFFAAKPLPSNLGLPLLRGLFILGAYTGNWLVE
jgi:hypothetical protein